MNIKRNIIFCLESRKRNGVPIVENVPIRMRVVYAGKRIEFYTGHRIDVSKWDKKTQRVRNGCTNKLHERSSDINAKLLKQHSTVLEIFRKFEVKDRLPTPEELKSEFAIRMGDKTSSNTPASIFATFDEFVREEGQMNTWTKSTYQKFEAVRNHLYGFDKDLTFEAIDEKRFTDYINYLRTEKGMRNTTIGKQVGFFKWFLRWANRKGHTDNRIFESFKPKLKTTQKRVVFLTWTELNQLKDYQIPESKQYLERVRDVFLFLCYTGLRYSDVYNLKKTDISDDYIEITTVKTSDSLRIEMNKHSRAILEKYKDFPFENGKALPVISNQKMNDYLKELAELAGLDEPIRETYYMGNERIDEIVPKYQLIGTHAGRRTFICNALSLGIPAQVVMKWTGHSDYKAMKPYIDVADEIKANAMKLFNDKF